MYQIAQNFTLRLILSFTLCASLLLLPGVSLLSEASQGQGQSAADNARPRQKRPEGILPDLEDVKNESHVEREAPPPIPSTVRAKRNEGKPWDGRRVGDPGTQQRPVDQPDEERQTRRAHARRRAAPPPLSEDQFIQNFFSVALLLPPTYNETLYWNYLLRAGYNQSQTSLKLAAIEFGRTLFESASYLARNRSAHDYVYDLYKTYLMREPDAGGWAYWEALVSSNGREYVRRGFEESGEFATLLATISPSGSAGPNPTSLITARVDPRNQPGNGMLSRDVSWSVPLLSLPGRNGLDLGLALSYSSMVWTHAEPYFYFDEDNGFPSPGFRLGFPTVQRKTFDAQTGKNAYLLITTAGHRVELRQTTTSTVYEAADSSYLQLTETGATLLVRSTDGTQLTFAEVNNEYRCNQIKDRNGNYLSVNYNALGQITNITDTLGRVITFNYDGNANLISITQTWNGQSHQWVSFGWGTRNMQYSFADATVIGIKQGTTVPVITQVALNDTSYFTFDYTNPLQVSLIKKWFGPLERNATAFTYETLSGDVPRLRSSSVSAMNWTGVNGLPAQVTTDYNVAGDGACVLTAPDGTVYKEYYGTGWQKGLPVLSEVWVGTDKKKWTTTAWTQDNTSVSYETNPRVTETNVYDNGGNRRRTTIDYGPYAQWGLPYLVSEYAAGGGTESRRTFTDYNLSQAYLDRRIIGLVSAVHLTDVGSFQGKVTYEYDDPARLTALPTPSPSPGPATATQHDSSYNNTSFTARGNLTSVSQWDVTDINNVNKKLTSYTNYFVTGSPKSVTDPSPHTSSISYIDAFSDGVDRHTFAYPTTLTDADSNSSTVQYNFDFGATTRTQSPAPAGQTQGTIKTMAYNNLGQLERVTLNNGAYKRFWYGPNYVASYATVNTAADELYAVQAFDGMGRVMGTARNHPGSSGGYSLVSVIYDQMGRVWQQSNPTEINSAWLVSGDDAAGIYYTQQTYDWKGRPLVTTNPDLTTKTASYSGCGCAGGEVVTLTDEGTIDGGVVKRRQQKIYSDVLGRNWKTEMLNWQDGSPYSTTVNTYNVRDQLTQVKQYAGTEGSGTFQNTTMTYDGYGRLRTKHLPEQQVDSNNIASTDYTTWDYNADGTVQKVTDARGAVSNFTYNGRHLVTGISYTLLSGVPTTGPSAVVPRGSESFVYDNAGHRTSMTDNSGGTTYQYNQLSQLVSETRTFTGLAGSYTLGYDYNLHGQLKCLTDHTSQRINYVYDTAGRLNSLSGTNYTYPQFINSVSYRAWGGPRQTIYGNGRVESFTYNARLAATHYEIPAGGGFTTAASVDYQYYDDGRLKYSHNLRDSRLDRRYEYDHLGRLVKGLSGAEARGEPATNDRPYNETATYDAFNHLNLRISQHWSRLHEFSSTDTYSNNRRVGWTYDADGNWLSGAGRQHTYDAAGRTSSTSWSSGGNFSDFFDGDGERVKATGTYGVTYYLRSTILGGKVVEELNSSGAKEHSLIYAWDRVVGHDWGNGSVSIMQTDPAGVSITSNSTQSSFVGSFSELDPWGAEVFSEDPYLVDPNFSGGRGESPPTYSGFGDVSMSSTGCMLDGVYTLCRFLDNTESLALQVTRGGQTKQYPLTTSALGLTTVWVEYQGKGLRKEPTPVDAEVSEGDIIVTNTESDGPGHWEFLNVDFSSQNAFSGNKFTRGTNPQKDPFRLSKCLQWLLAPYFKGAGEFRGLDLNEIDIYEGLPEEITRFAVIDVAAITLANSIYFAPGQYSGNLDGIELIAHELTHVKQWRLNGQIGFAAAYLSEYRKNRKAGMSEADAYANISFEKQAAEYAANIKEAIRKQYGESPCDKYKP
jgi:YD repeat-containing protein